MVPPVLCIRDNFFGSGFYFPCWFRILFRILHKFCLTLGQDISFLGEYFFDNKEFIFIKFSIFVEKLSNFTSFSGQFYFKFISDPGKNFGSDRHRIHNPGFGLTVPQRRLMFHPPTAPTLLHCLLKNHAVFQLMNSKITALKQKKSANVKNWQIIP